MIKYITFDLDDTLWSIQPVIDVANERLYEWYHQHASLYTKQFPLEYFTDLQKLTHEKHPELAFSVSAIRKTMIEIGLMHAGYKDAQLDQLCEEAFDVFLQARNDVDYFAEAIPMIERLHKDFTLGAISNGNADITRVGLDRYFDFAFNAEGVGFGKPDERIFQAMLSHVNAAPNEVLHIGDSIEHDVIGANNAGLHSLWVNLNNQRQPAAKPNIEVQCLSEIPQAIQHYQHQLIKR